MCDQPFLAGANNLQSYGSGMGFMAGASPRVSSSQPGANSTGGGAAGTQVRGV